VVVLGGAAGAVCATERCVPAATAAAPLPASAISDRRDKVLVPDTFELMRDDIDRLRYTMQLRGTSPRIGK